ncbi:MAG: HDIG domain-containing protein, partial [Gemmatimonadetes bacterium]|nr:HDIG domain-containing protein [Gemmatimonadota bacterium]
MKIRAIHLYVAFVCVLSVGAQLVLPWGELLLLSRDHVFGLAALTVLSLLAESLAITVTVGGSSGTSSITFLPILACVHLFGPAPAVLLLIVTGGIAEFFIRRKEAIRAVFNLAQYIVSTTLAGFAFKAAGGLPMAIGAAYTQGEFTPQLVPFISFGVVFLGLNHGAVSLAIALNEDLPFRHVWGRSIGSSGQNLLYDLLICPIAIALAFFYFQLGITGLLIILLPLLFIRHSYLTKLQLQQANRDLLKALVKAIEIRDPYTSGHSLRVSILAKNIAEARGLSSRKADHVETAALLHDIGKIEAIYSEILQKPESLSIEERKIIESHVTIGVE